MVMVVSYIGAIIGHAHYPCHATAPRVKMADCVANGEGDAPQPMETDTAAKLDNNSQGKSTASIRST